MELQTEVLLTNDGSQLGKKIIPNHLTTFDLESITFQDQHGMIMDKREIRSIALEENGERKFETPISIR
jgi:hypothetical protein